MSSSHNTHLELINRLLGDDSNSNAMFHFLERDFVYLCYGKQALYIADEFYKTRFGVKMEEDVEVLTIHKKFFRKLCKDLLRNQSLTLWQRNEDSSSWQVKAVANPGNHQTLEQALGGYFETDDTSSHYILGITINEQEGILSLSIVSTMIYRVYLGEYSICGNDEDIEKTIQTLIKGCIQQYFIHYVLYLHPIHDPSTTTDPLFTIFKRVLATRCGDITIEEIAASLAINNNNHTHDNTETIRMTEKLSTMVFLSSSSSSSSTSSLTDILQKHYPLASKLLLAVFSHLQIIPSSNSNHSSQQHGQQQQYIISFLPNSTSISTIIATSQPATTVTATDIEEGVGGSCLYYDHSVRALLQIFPNDHHHSSNSSKMGRSLFDLLATNLSTKMGQRLLRQYLSAPLSGSSYAILQQRQACIQSFISLPRLLNELIEEGGKSNSWQYLQQYPDIEKLALKLIDTTKTTSSADKRSNSSKMSTLSSLRDLVDIYRAILRAEKIAEMICSHLKPESSAAATSADDDLALVQLAERLLAMIQEKMPGYCTMIEQMIDETHFAAIIACKQTTSSSGSSSMQDDQQELQKHVVRRLLQDHTALRIRPSFTSTLQEYHDQLLAIQDQIIQDYQAVFQAIHGSSTGDDTAAGSSSSGKKATSTTSSKRASKASIASSSSAANKTLLHFEYSEVHGYHYRITQRQEKMLAALDQAKTSAIRYTIVSQQKAGILFKTTSLARLLTSYETIQADYQEEQASLVQEAMQTAATYRSSLLGMSEMIAQIDVYAGLAKVAISREWTLPRLFIRGEQADQRADQPADRAADQQQVDKLILHEVRHPLVEEQIGSLAIVKNNLCIDYYHDNLADGKKNKRVKIITGPNMGGKSTYLKAIGIMVILAQMGAPIPAAAGACLPFFDRICYRSSSTTSSFVSNQGESTVQNLSSFMAEMVDLQEMLSTATSSSLVLIDEIGRGTSTNDGYGLAYAILEELAYKNQATILCATHFHELHALADERPAVADDDKQTAQADTVVESLHVDAMVDEIQQDVIMLYQMLPGPSSHSYGIHCAKMAGFPIEIIEEATRIEQEELDDSKGSNGKESQVKAAIDGKNKRKRED